MSQTLKYCVLQILKEETKNVHENEKEIQDILSSRNGFEKLVKKYASLVRYILKRNGFKNNQDLEDAQQEIWIEIFKHLKDYDPSIASLKTWIGRIATYKGISLLRRKYHPTDSIESYDDDDDDENENPIQQIPSEEKEGEEELEEKEKQKTILQAIRKLPLMYRQVIVLCYLRGQSMQEMSDKLDVNINTIKIRLMRAKQMLNKKLRYSV